VFTPCGRVSTARSARRLRRQQQQEHLQLTAMQERQRCTCDWRLTKRNTTSLMSVSIRLCWPHVSSTARSIHPAEELGNTR